MLVLVSLLVAAPALADTVISFTPVGMNPDNLQIYNASGGLVGIYNTSSQGLQFSDGCSTVTSYSVLVVPANDNLLGNHPDTWFGLFVNKIQQNSTAIIIIIFLICMLIAARRR